MTELLKDGRWTAARADQCGDPCGEHRGEADNEAGAVCSLIRREEEAARTEEEREYIFWQYFQLH